jgi:hypothetical protein
MKFIEFVAVIKRHKLLIIYGLLVAAFVAAFSAYRLDGSTLVSRSEPVYETTAVVAITPGPEINLPKTVPTTVPTTPALAGEAAVSATTATTTTVAEPPDDVIDSRSLYYAALSLKTAVVAPGFSEQVRAKVDGPAGSITAVTALDTNTIRMIVSASTPTAAADTMDVALTELQALVRSYATSPSVRYTLDSTVVSAPSTPATVPSIKGPLTVVLVFGVALVLVWMVVRAVDILQLHRREARQLKRARDQRAEELRIELESAGPHLAPESTRVPSP